MNEEMKKAMAGKAMPELAIVDNNTLAALGLKGLLESAVPMVKISIFGTFGEFESNAPERFMHYFVSMQILLAHRNFSSKRRIAPIPSCLPPATTSTRSCRDSTASASTYRNQSSSDS